MSILQGDNLNQKINNLRSLCIAVGLIQKELALMDIWLRGGVSSGEAYFSRSKNQIIGPAYINAYILDETIAIFPRVLVDSKIIYELDCSSAQELVDLVNKSKEGGMKYRNWGPEILFNWDRNNRESDFQLQQDTALLLIIFVLLLKRMVEI